MYAREAEGWDTPELELRVRGHVAHGEHLDGEGAGGLRDPSSHDAADGVRRGEVAGLLAAVGSVGALVTAF